MCQEMYRRSTDSVEFALYGVGRKDGFTLRVQLQDGSTPGADEAVVAARELVQVRDAKFVGPNVRLEVDSDAGGDWRMPSKSRLTAPASSPLAAPWR